MKTEFSEPLAFKFDRCHRTTCVLGLALVIMLIASSSVEASGFNVNSEVMFTPLTSTYRTTNSTTGCPAGFAGKFTFTALLTNKTGSPAMPGVVVHVLTLTNGNVLLDPQTNAILGGEGAEMAVPKVEQYADGLLSPNESVNVPFVLCLKAFQPFQFFVDVFGIVTRLVTVNRFGMGAGTVSSFPMNRTTSMALSGDGSVLAFSTSASDLTAINDTNDTIDVFVRDFQSGTTSLVSVNRLGTASGNGGSGAPVISQDGRFVVFTSFASDLVANDTNEDGDVFVRDLRLGTTTLVSVNRLGIGSGNGYSLGLQISADGRFVAFESFATDLVGIPRAGASHSDVFVRDLQLGTTTLVSVNRLGTGSGNDFSVGPSISPDGRFVAFQSQATDLVAAFDTNSHNNDVFVRDLQLGTTTLVSVKWVLGPAMITRWGLGSPRMAVSWRSRASLAT